MSVVDFRTSSDSGVACAMPAGSVLVFDVYRPECISPLRVSDGILYGGMIRASMANVKMGDEPPVVIRSFCDKGRIS